MANQVLQTGQFAALDGNNRVTHMETYRPPAGNAAFTGESPADAARNNTMPPSPAVRRSLDTQPQHRQNDRISVTGWTRIQGGGPESVAVRVDKLSRSGLQIFLDFKLHFWDNYPLQLSIYRHGKTHTFNVLAHCVSIALASNKGFRHGFEFEALDRTAEDALREILG